MLDDQGARTWRATVAAVMRPMRGQPLRWLIVFFLMFGTTVASSDDVRRVLVIYSNGRLLEGNVEIEQGLRKALSTPPKGHVEIYSEFLETEFADPSYEPTVTAYLRAKYAQHRPNVIVAVARPALAFVLHHRDLFPDAPVVHAAVFTRYLAENPALPSDVVGVPVEYDAAGTIEQALRWHPSARRLVMVLGSTPRDREWERVLRLVTGKFEGRVDVEFLSGLPTAGILDRVAALGPECIVFTPGYYQSGDATRFRPRDSVEAIARASSVPVYSWFSTFVGTGVVGGWSTDFAEVGTQAGQTVERLLNGASPATLTLAPVMPNRLRVDWRQTRRWGIADSDIPHDAVVRFKEPTFWDVNHKLVIIIATVILLQAALIHTLLIERRRRRKAEMAVQAQRSEIAHASRRAIAGELTASIAHEINQPLGAILASADAAEMILKAGGDRREDLTRIISRIRRDDLRASDVIRKLRALLAKHEPQRERFDLGLMISDVAKLLEAEGHRREVALEVRPMQTEAMVVGDPVQLQQVLINLILNAMEAIADMPPGRRSVMVDAALDGDSVRVSVRDRGQGIAADNLPKIFESFFSTKQRGMGLGLSIARTIVEAHGGRIQAENGLVHGAVFQVDLPAAAIHSASMAAA